VRVPPHYRFLPPAGAILHAPSSCYFKVPAFRLSVPPSCFCAVDSPLCAIENGFFFHRIVASSSAKRTRVAPPLSPPFGMTFPLCECCLSLLLNRILFITRETFGLNGFSRLSDYASSGLIWSDLVRQFYPFLCLNGRLFLSGLFPEFAFLGFTCISRRPGPPPVVLVPYRLPLPRVCLALEKSVFCDSLLWQLSTDVSTPPPPTFSSPPCCAF